MPVWFHIVIFGSVIATGGPLPYNMAECEWRAEHIERQLVDDWQKKNLDTSPGMIFHGKTVHLSDIKMECFESERPSL